MKTYELHTLKNGKWKIDSVFDNAETAMEEVKRAQSTERYDTLRLIEEEYDEAQNKTVTRTLFLAEGTNKKPVQPALRTKGGDGSAKDGGSPAAAAKGAAAAARSPITMTRILITAVGLFILGFGIIATLEIVAQH